MKDLHDMRNIRLEVGQVIAYGKSSRYNPISIGKIISITDKEIEVLGKGNTKTGKLCHWAQDRIIVLPDNYLSEGD